MTRLSCLGPVLSFWAALGASGCLEGAGPSGGPPAARVEVVAAESALLVGHSLQLAARAWDSAGNAISTAGLAWHSTDSALLAVDGSGLVQAQAGSTGGDAHVVAQAPRGLAADTQRLHVAVHGEVKWRLALGLMPVAGGPAQGSEGMVYVLTSDDPPAYRSRLLAIRPTGLVEWERSLTQVLDNFPVVGPDGAVHVVGQHVWVFNPDGSLRWSLTDRPSSLPSLYSGAVSADGVLLAAMGFDLFAFAASDGDTLWQGPGTSDASWIVPATFSADGRTVFIKRSTDSGYARVTASGALRWQVPDPLAGRLGFAGPAVAAGRVYFAGAYQLLAADTLGMILGVSPDRGCCVSEPAIGPDGTLYVQVGGNAQGVWAFNPFNTARWGFPGVRPSRGWYGGPAVAAGGVLYAAASDGFYALQLSPAGATVRWRFPADTSQRLKFYGAPLIGRDGTVYSFTSTVGGTDPVDATDELFAFWEDKPVEPDSPWPMWRHDARRSGQAHR